MSTLFFRQASPISKNCLINIFNDVKLCTSVVIAPFGLSPSTVDTMGLMLAIDEYTKIFKVWQEFLSQKIYALHGVPEDMVAASMNVYVQQRPDKEVMMAIQGCQEAVLSMLNPPVVLELRHTFDAEETASIMKKVITALQRALPGLTMVSAKDKKMLSNFGFCLDISLPSPVEVAETLHSVNAQLESSDRYSLLDVIREIKDALTVPGSTDCLTYEEYIAMVELYYQTNPVQELLANLVDRSEGATSSCRHSLDALRLGLVMWDAETSAGHLASESEEGGSSLPMIPRVLPSVGVHPCVAFSEQCMWFETGGANEALSIALSLRNKGLRMCGRVGGSGEISDSCPPDDDGDPVAAIGVFTRALRADGADKDEDEDEDEEYEYVLQMSDDLPTFLCAQLLVDRAECFVRTGEFSKAMSDCDAAIDLNPRYAAAFSCRAQLWMEEEMYSSIEIERDNKSLLMRKVQDALTAFHLGGGADAKLGALAEETAREISKEDARALFVSRGHSKDFDAKANTPPKQWLVLSFLSGYDLLSASMGVGADTDGSCVPSFLLEGSSVSEDFTAMKDGDVEAYCLLRTATQLLEDMVVGSCDVDEKVVELNQEVIVVPDGDSSAINEVLSWQIVASGKVEWCPLQTSELDCTLGTSYDNFSKVLDLFVSESASLLVGASLYPGGRLDELLLNSTEADTGLALRSVSAPLRARLLSIVSTIAFLCGDSKGAEQCLRASLDLDDSLVDSRVKLAALLSDMSQEEEAMELLVELPRSPVVSLHLAEAQILQNDFDSAVDILQQARFAVEMYAQDGQPARSYDPRAPIDTRQRWWTREKLAPQVDALLGVALFRSNPNAPEAALEVLRSAAETFPRAENLQLCLGELLAQAGDAPSAISAFRHASALSPGNPMPYLNAARTFGQMGCTRQAATHHRKARSLDPTLSMTYVDLAQVEVSSGRFGNGMILLEKALLYAKHVSEMLDVLTVRMLSQTQQELEEKGICPRSSPRDDEDLTFVLELLAFE